MKQVRGRQLLTPARKATFLKVLAETGSAPAAARAASPHATGKRAAIRSFTDLRDRDPEFAAAWEDAMAAALGRVENEVMRRAMEPTYRPIFSKGELVGQEPVYDNKLLLAVARKLNPDEWSEKRQVEMSGSVEHRHGHIYLSMSDIHLLAPDRADQLLDLLGEIADKREPLTIAHQDGGEHE
ncbi:MAG: hypothetical protein U1E40_10280 [Amaricoccus sp.]